MTYFIFIFKCLRVELNSLQIDFTLGNNNFLCHIYVNTKKTCTECFFYTYCLIIMEKIDIKLCALKTSFHFKN